MIPDQLKNLTFCKVLPKSKRAFENDWQLHQLGFEDIKSWVSSGNNYGIICSRKNGVGIIDADHEEYVNAVENLLPETFSVQSSSEKKRHFYFKIKNFPTDRNKITLLDPSSPEDRGKQGGDIRMGEFYVLGPGSIHPLTKKPYFVKDNVPIAEIDFSQIIDVFSHYFAHSIIKQPKQSVRYDLPITDVCKKYNIELKSNKKDAIEFFCAHPVHGSEGGTNFGVNIDKNVWVCRRHNTGGSAFHLVAMMEKIVDCSSLVDKMSKEARDKTLSVIKEKFGVEFTVNWDVTKDGLLKPSYNNTLNVIEEHELDIRLNEFSDEIEYKGRKYTDRDSIDIKEMLRPLKIEPNVSTIDEAVTTFAMRNKYHPVKDYLLSIKWDGVSRLNSWLIDMAGADKSDYSAFVSRTMLLSAVYRVFDPGCQYDYMPIIEGDQGIGKTSILRIIGGKWYKSISLTEHDKDTIQKMQGAWIIEVAELAAFSKRDIDSLKAFITVCVDSSRFAYNRHDKKYPRQSVFVGTINPENNGYLLDKTGNRRFLPILVTNINTKKIEQLRDQLFAEAVELYRSGVKIYIEDKALLDQATSEQGKREEQDDWAEVITNWVSTHSLDISTKMTTCDVYTKAIGGRPEQYDNRIARRIGNILRKLGCGSSRLEKINGLTGKYYDLSKLSLSSVTEPAWTD